jgi:hypothetical protein
MFDPKPHVHLLVGPPKVGKTTFALWVARAFCLGVAPWAGAPRLLPGARVAVVSREQPAERLLETLFRLDQARGPDDPSIADHLDRVVLVARDPDLPEGGLDLLTLNDASLRVVRDRLLQARDAGSPFGLLLLDSFSRLKPENVNENDAGDVSRWLDKLDALAQATGVYILLIHHTGHATGKRRRDPRSASRGSSAIAAVAQVLWLFDRDERQPQRRVLRVDGNAVFDETLHFRVSSSDSASTEILFFELEGAEPIVPPESFLKPGVELSQSDLAWQIQGAEPVPGKRPSGSAQARAKMLIEAWSAEGLVDVQTRGRGALGVLLRSPQTPCGIRW